MPADAGDPPPDGPPALRIAEVTHELRTPVAGMIGMAALLLDTGLTPEQVAYAEAIRGAGRSLLLVIDDILDAAADAAGADGERPFSPRRMVEDIAELLAPRAMEKEIEIAAFVDPAVPERLLGDGGRVRQILLNLAGNAVKFTGRGGVGLRVEAHADGIAFAVHDTGPGMPPAVQARLLGRGPKSEAADPAAGLGLAIVARLVQQLGGRLAVDAAPGRGTTVVVTLPLATVPTVAGERSEGLVELRVLVVARSPFAAPWLVERLAAAGATAALAGDARGARRRLADHAFDLLIADRGLGPDVVRLASACRMSGIRTIALVTPAERRDLGTLHAEGFDQFLVKPVRVASLLALLRPAAAALRGANVPVAAPISGRALVAEDDAVNGLLARAHLMRAGYSVDAVASGTAAVAAFDRAFAEGRPFDIGLLDLHLPELGGCDAARRIRALEREHGARRSRLVGISAGRAQRAEALAAGMDAFLDKPFDGDALLAAAVPLPAVG